MLNNSTEIVITLLLVIDVAFVVIFILLWRYVRHLRSGMDSVEGALDEASNQLAEAGGQLRTVVKTIYAGYKDQEVAAGQKKNTGGQQQAPVLQSNEDVLCLLERGYQYKVIADRLGVSVDHVRLVSRIHNIYPEDGK